MRYGYPVQAELGHDISGKEGPFRLASSGAAGSIVEYVGTRDTEVDGGMSNPFNEVHLQYFFELDLLCLYKASLKQVQHLPSLSLWTTHTFSTPLNLNCDIVSKSSGKGISSPYRNSFAIQCIATATIEKIHITNQNLSPETRTTSITKCLKPSSHAHNLSLTASPQGKQSMPPNSCFSL